ncbi:hypothetical protein F5Y16DRAFT_392452 [Xylariaceae sp. FL0255]|nr:hypothetical protein F5Y16DRAFT_392452 [Xylariaceae sp. FL0255]
MVSCYLRVLLSVLLTTQRIETKLLQLLTMTSDSPRSSLTISFNDTEDEFASNFLNDRKHHGLACPSCTGRRRRLCLFVFVQIIGTAICAILLLKIFRNIAKSPMTDHELIVATNAYSPFLAHQEVHMYMSFSERRDVPLSVFGQLPSDETDRAWKSLYDPGMFFLITQQEVSLLGKDPGTAVKAPKSWRHIPDDLYVGIAKGKYDIYCLDKVRKFAWKEYYYAGNMTEAIEIEALNCLDLLKQSSTCKFSTDVFTYTFIDSQETPRVDFNNKRKCQVYNDLKLFKAEHRITEQQFRELRRTTP